MNVPIWPGSSSFIAASASFYGSNIGLRPTPFGYYDSDTVFKVEADKLADYCARSVGYPIMDVELQDINFWAAFEESTTKFTTMVNMYNAKDYILTLQGTTKNTNLSGREIQTNLGRTIQMAKSYGTEAGSGGTVDWKRGYVVTNGVSQSYDLNVLWANVSESGKRIEIKRVFHNEDPAIVRYFDPMSDTGRGSQAMLEGFGFGSYSPAVSFLVMPLYADLLRMQAIEMNDQIRKSSFTFEIQNNKVQLFPIPEKNVRVYFDYVLIDDRNNPLATPTGSISDLSNVPYDRIQFMDINDIGVQWIYEYALAVSKSMLGLVRGKYGTIPIPGADTTLNGADLIAQADATKLQLITDLKELLLSMGREMTVVAEAAIGTALQQQLAKVPSKIYIK